MKQKYQSIIIIGVVIFGISLWRKMALAKDNFLGVFEITGYSNDYKSTRKHPGDKGYGVTKSGKVAKWGTIAADLKVLPLGAKVKIEGFDTVFTVEDIGGAIKGNKLDIWYPTEADATQWGRQHRKVWRVN